MINIKCPVGKAECDATAPQPCVYSKEGLCDYPNRSLSHYHMTPDAFEALRRDLSISSWQNTFDKFKRRPGTEAALQAFAEFAHDPNDKPFLLCYGPTGNGKSHLLDAVVIEWAYKGKFAHIWQFVDVLDDLRGYLRDKEQPWKYDGQMKYFCREAKYLLWDEVGMGSGGSDFAPRVLEQVVVSRCRPDVRLPTVLVTNLDINQLPERIVSRARDKTLARLVLNSAGDYRPQKEV